MTCARRISLINPPPLKRIERGDMADYPHLGLGYMAAYLKSKGCEVQIIDGKFERIDFQDVKQRLSLWQPDIVGITAMTHEIKRAVQVAEMVKEIFPEVTTVVGGPHATALPAQTLIEFPSFDVAVFGEGEYTLFELVSAIGSGRSLENVKGIAYRVANRIQTNEPRGLINNLDELPFPAWELYPGSNVYPVITVRGCPFSCNFCMRVLGSKLRKRTPVNVINELKSLVDTYGARFIHFMDETFTIDQRQLNELLAMMLENGLHESVAWDAQTRADVADGDLLQRMKDANCKWIGFGIESGNARVLKAAGKGITLNQASQAVKAAKKAGLKTDGFFIFGHPFETAKTVWDTINFATRLNTTRVTFGIMVPYPGTQIYELARKGEGGYRLISQNWQDFNKNIGNSLELTGLSRKQMERAQILGYLKFYLFNLRFIAGAQYLVRQRRLALAIVKKALGIKNAR